ncbi:MAG: hypothetical protein ACR652_08155 [Methylocystis sp.]|uniref:hypothetical protein n=1 Tax=Methylocystis sp. TaxID=1911079 RepID=UPI003DA47D30
MQSRTRTPDIRLDVASAWSDLVRAFVRETSLAEGAPLAVANRITEGALLIWSALCKRQADGARARLATSTRNSDMSVRFFISGHDRFSRIMPSLFEGLPDDLGVSYRERGIDGWEITLHTAVAPLAPAAHASVDDDDADATSGESFEIGLPQKDDSAAIARCFLQVYGRHYIHSEVFSPRRYWAKVESGELVPVIARNASGEIVGHVALEREPGARIAERGQAVVLPTYRGHRLLERMTERLSRQAETIGLTGVFAQPVTIHTFSQRNDDRAGMPVCAAMLGMLPEDVLPKGLTIPTRGQRQSLLLSFRFLAQPGEREIYAPPAYRDVIQDIAARLGLAARFCEEAGPSAEHSVIEVKMERIGAASIRVEAIGAAIGTELRQAFSDVMSLGADHVQICAPLQDPALPRLAACARELGFYFCGLGPAFLGDHDALLLQSAKQPVDVTKLQLFADHARELVRFIEEDRRIVEAAKQA